MLIRSRVGDLRRWNPADRDVRFIHGFVYYGIGADDNAVRDGYFPEDFSAGGNVYVVADMRRFGAASRGADIHPDMHPAVFTQPRIPVYYDTSFMGEGQARTAGIGKYLEARLDGQQI